MNVPSDKAQEANNPSVANASNYVGRIREHSAVIEDNRPGAIAQMKLQRLVNESPQVKQLDAYQEIANNSPQAFRAAQFKAIANNRLLEEQPANQETKAEAIQLKGEVIQRGRGNGDDNDDEGDSDDETGDALEGINEAATVVATLTGDSQIGEAMEAIADFSEAAGDTQEAVSSGWGLSQLLGAANAMNYLSGMLSGYSIPFLGQAKSAIELAQNTYSTIPQARAERQEAQEDVARPDLEVGRTPEERQQRLETATSAENEAYSEAASQAGGVTGVPLLDKAASLTATAALEGPSVALEKGKEDTTKKAKAVYTLAQKASGMACKSIASWYQRKDNDDNDPDDDLFDRMERGELNSTV